MIYHFERMRLIDDMTNGTISHEVTYVCLCPDVEGWKKELLVYEVPESVDISHLPRKGTEQELNLIYGNT